MPTFANNTADDRSVFAEHEHQKSRTGHHATHIDESRNFYTGLFGFQVAMDMGWVVTFVSPSNPTAQITLVRGDESSKVQPQMTIEVDNVDEVHAKAVERGLSIVYPLTNEPWGVRRFFVADPNGLVINVMNHIDTTRAG